MTPRAVLFDAYGTLFDVHSVALRADAYAPGLGRRLSALWRDKQLEYTRLVTMSGAGCWRPFDELTRAALRHAAERLQIALTPAQHDALVAEYGRLDPFPECGGVLAELHRRGIAAGILSNGEPAMLDAVVANAGWRPLLPFVVSVQPARHYKTHPTAYAMGPAALGLPAADILFVSSNAWDAIGATWFGYTTLWVDRAGVPLDPLGTEPTHRGRSLSDVLGLFDG